MNKMLLTHGAWLLVSVAAFAVGGNVLSDKSTPAETKNERGNGLSAIAAEKALADDPAADGAGLMKDDAEPSYQQALATLSKGGDPKVFYGEHITFKFVVDKGTIKFPANPPFRFEFKTTVKAVRQ